MCEREIEREGTLIVCVGVAADVGLSVCEYVFVRLCVTVCVSGYGGVCSGAEV